MGATTSNLKSFQILKIQNNTAAHKHNLLPFFHFITEINNQPIISPSDIKRLSENWKNNSLKLKIYDARTEEFFEIDLKHLDGSIGGFESGNSDICNGDVKNSNSIGMSVKMYEGVPYIFSLRIVTTFPNSASSKAGLISEQDYIIGIENVQTKDDQEFYSYLFKNREQEVILIVFNLGMQSIRRVILVPEREELLGCEIATGVFNLPPSSKMKLFFDFEINTARKENNEKIDERKNEDKQEKFVEKIDREKKDEKLDGENTEDKFVVEELDEKLVGETKDGKKQEIRDENNEELAKITLNEENNHEKISIEKNNSIDFFEETILESKNDISDKKNLNNESFFKEDLFTEENNNKTERVGLIDEEGFEGTDLKKSILNESKNNFVDSEEEMKDRNITNDIIAQENKSEKGFDISGIQKNEKCGVETQKATSRENSNSEIQNTEGVKVETQKVSFREDSNSEVQNEQSTSNYSLKNIAMGLFERISSLSLNEDENVEWSSEKIGVEYTECKDLSDKISMENEKEDLQKIKGTKEKQNLTDNCVENKKFFKNKFKNNGFEEIKNSNFKDDFLFQENLENDSKNIQETYEVTDEKNDGGKDLMKEEIINSGNINSNSTTKISDSSSSNIFHKPERESADLDRLKIFFNDEVKSVDSTEINYDSSNKPENVNENRTGHEIAESSEKIVVVKKQTDDGLDKYFSEGENREEIREEEFILKDIESLEKEDLKASNSIFYVEDNQTKNNFLKELSSFEDAEKSNEEFFDLKNTGINSMNKDKTVFNETLKEEITINENKKDFIEKTSPVKLENIDYSYSHEKTNGCIQLDRPHSDEGYLSESEERMNTPSLSDPVTYDDSYNVKKENIKTERDSIFGEERTDFNVIPENTSKKEEK